MYKSEIRASTISNLLSKVAKKSYYKYLWRVNIQRIRGFSDKTITFDFPVTALIGPNGSGKSSVLGAAGCAYKEIRPSKFFPKSAIGDQDMADWSVSHDVVDKALGTKGDFSRTAKFKNSRWKRDAFDRTVLFFGIERTVPAGEKTVFKKLATPRYCHSGELNNIEEMVAVQVGCILGKEFKNYKETKFNDNNSFLVGKNGDREFSEFHFGAGESSVIRMVEAIEHAPNHSLILIEEIENGLHPVAVAKMVEYLIDVADRKNIQTIFTTHSDYAIQPLPNEAIWACLDGELYNGKLSVESLRAISGRVDKKLAIFVEDEFARRWVDAILKNSAKAHYLELEIIPAYGDGNAEKFHKNSLENPAMKINSLCILDGDSSSKTQSETILRLPGQQPEKAVFYDVYDHLDKNIARLKERLHLTNYTQSELKQKIEKIQFENRDKHLQFEQIGDDLEFTSEEIVVSAFLSVWIEQNPEICKELADKVIKHLTAETKISA